MRTCPRPLANQAHTANVWFHVDLPDVRVNVRGRARFRLLTHLTYIPPVCQHTYSLYVN